MKKETNVTTVGQVANMDWCQPGLSMQEFHDSNHKFRCIIGGRGCGKTTGSSIEALRHCFHYAGAKVLCVRKTSVSNDSTSLPTFKQTYQKCGFVESPDETSLFRTWDSGRTTRIPSRRAIEALNAFITEKERSKIEVINWIKTDGDRLCSYIIFKGLKDEDVSQGTLRGFECSMMIFIEADLLTRYDFGLARACLRWRDCDGNLFPDYPCILDTNPPNTDHWIALMESNVTEKSHPDYDSDFKFWHIKSEENQHITGKAYVDGLKKEYRGNPGMYKKMVLGMYADVFEGIPVYWAFSINDHIHTENLGFPRGSYLVRGWDFGVNNATVWAAYFSQKLEDGKTYEYWWDLLELYAEGSDTERQCRAVIDMTNKVFPFHSDRNICAGVMDYIDPAGAAKTDKGSSVQVMNNFGFRPGWSFKLRSLSTSLSVGNRLLEMKDFNGNHQYRICKKGCPRVVKGLMGAYRYPSDKEPGYKDEPLKGPQCDGVDHIMDAWRYPKINILKLAESIVKHDTPMANGSENYRTKNIERRSY